MKRLLPLLAFAAGLLVIGWTAAGYLPSHPLALALVLLIGVFYVAGTWELYRFQQATDTLTQQLAQTRDSPPSLATWLAPLHPSLYPAVRLRVEGERVALPGPALTPYLTGLLVLLGMLGTFLGMVATLRGTGLALESATDVDAIRASLVAPVKGLGLAFGTSVAGVAASAMLGWMSALVRRERQRAGRQLDLCVATTLRDFSPQHQREESLRLQRLQAELLPALVAQLQTLVTQVDQQGQALHQRLLESQATFQGEAQKSYGALAESVDRSLKASLSESARLAGAAIEPAVQAAMQGLTSEATALREVVQAAVQQQLDGMSTRLDASTAQLAERWQAAFAEQRAQSAAITQQLQASLEGVAQGFERQATSLVEGVSSRLDRSASTWAASMGEVLKQQQRQHEALVQQWREASAASAAGMEQQASSLLRQVGEAHAAWESTASAREAERMQAFHDGLARMSAAWHQQATEDAAAAAARQQQICTTLERTAETITAQAEAHARATIGEIARLMDVASAAPRAAAEVIGELRGALSESLQRDNTALDERNRLMTTLSGLLDAVNHASTEQRAAIDALVQATDEALRHTRERFAERVEAESKALHEAAAQVTSSVAEVASLGEGFGAAVQLFSQASEQLMGQLQRIESALGQSMARSDEQLAYYVAQAREIVDLTLGSQKQIVDDLQQLAQTRSAEAAKPAAEPSATPTEATPA